MTRITGFVGEFCNREFAKLNQLSVLRLAMLCKKGPIWNVTILVDSGRQLAGKMCTSVARKYPDNPFDILNGKPVPECPGIGQKEMI